MALTQLGVGSVLSLHPDSFQVGQSVPSRDKDTDFGTAADDDASVVSSWSANSKSTVSALYTAATGKASSKQERASYHPKFPSNLRSKISTATTTDHRPLRPSLYGFKISFQSHTQYYMIPYEKFEAIWANEDLVLAFVKAGYFSVLLFDYYLRFLIVVRICELTALFLCSPPTTVDIQSQLAHVNNEIMQKLEHLKPWITGSIEYLTAEVI